jgi:hypothetical protein
MKANATTSLLNVTLNIEKHNEIKMETNPTKVTLIIMESMLATSKCSHNINCNYMLYLCY